MLQQLKWRGRTGNHCPRRWKYVKGINDYGKEQTYMYLGKAEGKAKFADPFANSFIDENDEEGLVGILWDKVCHVISGRFRARAYPSTLPRARAHNLTPEHACMRRSAASQFTRRWEVWAVRPEMCHRTRLATPAVRWACLSLMRRRTCWPCLDRLCSVVCTPSPGTCKIPGGQGSTVLKVAD